MSSSPQPRRPRSVSELLGFSGCPGAHRERRRLRMYHAINAAIVRSIEEGIASSCSLMVPCPWALHAMHLLPSGRRSRSGSTSRWSASDPLPLGAADREAESAHAAGETGELYSSAPDSRAARPGLVSTRWNSSSRARSMLWSTPADARPIWTVLSGRWWERESSTCRGVAEEYGLAARVWLEPGRQKLRRRGLAVVITISWTASVSTSTASRPIRRLAARAAGRSERVGGTSRSGQRGVASNRWRLARTSDRDYEFLTSPGAASSSGRRGSS